MSRNSHWFSVAAFTTIALVSIVNNFPEGEDIKDQEDYTKWVVSAMSIALTFSTLGVFANLLLKDKFEGQILEGGLVSSTNIETSRPKVKSEDGFSREILYRIFSLTGSPDLWVLGKCYSRAHGSRQYAGRENHFFDRGSNSTRIFQSREL